MEVHFFDSYAPLGDEVTPYYAMSNSSPCQSMTLTPDTSTKSRGASHTTFYNFLLIIKSQLIDYYLFAI